MAELSHKPGSRPAVAHATLAMEEGFYLEALTLYEYLIEDQLLGYYNTLQDSKVRFSSLTALLGKLRSGMNERVLSEPEQDLQELVSDLESWSKTRVAMRSESALAEDSGQWKKVLKGQKKQAKQARKYYKKIDRLMRRISEHMDSAN